LVLVIGKKLEKGVRHLLLSLFTNRDKIIVLSLDLWLVCWEWRGVIVYHIVSR